MQGSEAGGLTEVQDNRAQHYDAPARSKATDHSTMMQDNRAQHYDAPHRSKTTDHSTMMHPTGPRQQITAL
ncbi:hypothetical protein ACOMHN_021580 [Nucella lapillus]